MFYERSDGMKCMWLLVMGNQRICKDVNQKRGKDDKIMTSILGDSSS